MGDVIELDDQRVVRALAEEKAPEEWRRFVRAVARDVVEHLPDELPWKTAPGVLNLPASTLSAAALRGGLVVARREGTLHLLVRECEACLIDLMSVKLSVPRPLALVPVG